MYNLRYKFSILIYFKNSNAEFLVLSHDPAKKSF